MGTFFERQGDVFVPGDFCRGPWNHDSLHGGAISGLLAYGVEGYAPGPEWRISRVTVDMFRLAPHRPTLLRTRLLRDGNRIRSVEASLEVEGVEVARASGLLLLATDVPPTSWAAYAEPVPGPEAGTRMEDGDGPFGDFRDGYEARQVRAPGERDLSVAWLRMAHPFIEGETTSPFVRTAAAADSVNPVANRSEPRRAFINADVTLHLFRYPEGEWIGFRPIAHDSRGGVAIASCELRDLDGAIGRGTVATIANDRERTRASTPTVQE